MRPFCDVLAIYFRQKNMSVLGAKTDMFFYLGHVQNNFEMQTVFLRKILYNVYNNGKLREIHVFLRENLAV